MTIKKKTASSSRIERDSSVTDIFEVLSNRRRRYALYYLNQRVGAIHVSDLADQIALWEGEHTFDRYERICTSLVHVHLPKLTDAGIVEYDPVRETVELRDRAGQVAPYLDLSASVDFR